MLDAARLPAVSCRRAAGIATDEWQTFSRNRNDPTFAPFDGRRLYLFSPSAWRAETLQSLQRAPASSTP